MPSGIAFGAMRDAALLALASAILALGVNALRSHGIPLVQNKDYDILVPCSEGGGQIAELQPRDPLLANPTSLIVDARSKQEFEAWHLPAAINIAFDYLEPTAPADLKRVTSSRAARVIVYGDGEDPDSGRELGRELSGKGIRNVFVVNGGAPALRPGAPEGQRP